MLTVLHVVGESDTGNADLCQDRLPRRRERVRRWLAAMDGGPEVPDLLRTGRLPGFPEPPFAATPLTTVLTGLEPEVGEVRLVLLGTSARTDSVPTTPIAAAMVGAVRTRPEVFGPRVVEARHEVADGFGEAEVAGLVREALWAHRPDGVVMTWGSGATGLLLAAAAGVLEAGAPLRLRASGAESGDVALAPEPTVAPLVPWLLRLGYPEQVGVLAGRGLLDPPPGDDVLAHAAGLAGRLDRVGRGRGDAADLAEWVRGDLRRLDGTAGMAVRAWVEARYRRWCATEGCLDLLDWARSQGRPAGGPVLTLGQVLGVLDHVRQHPGPAVSAAMASASGRWLRSREVSMINKAAGDSAHEAVPMRPAVMGALRECLPPVRSPAGLPVFGLPSGEVAVVWTAGTSGHRPYADTLLGRPLGPEVLRQCGLPADGRPDLACLILGTGTAGGSLPAAHAQAAALTDGRPHHGAVRSRAIAVEQAVAGTEEIVATALAESAPEVDAVVVVPIGPKDVALGALLAALRHGRARAIPVMLASTDRAATAASYHRVVPYLTADRVLAALAGQALRRLELGTAARLCGTGSPELQAVGVRLGELDTWLWRPGAEGLRGRLRLCAARLRPEPGRVVGEPDRVRLVHVAAGLAERHADRRRPREIRQLVDVRNRLVVSHGRPEGQVSVAAAITAATGMPDPSAAKLVERAAACCPAGPDDRIARCYEPVERALAELAAGTALDNSPGR